MNWESQRRRLSRLLLLELLLLGGLIWGCRQSRYSEMFQKQIAPLALDCLHPTGEFQYAGDIELTDSGFKGPIYWKGGFLGNNYVTNVEIRIDDRFVTVYLLDDTSVLPALDRNCQFPIRDRK
jgi:hypothetical protein